MKHQEKHFNICKYCFQVYWPLILKELSLSFREEPKCILDTTDRTKRSGSWLPGSVLNIAECCLLATSHPKKQENSLAIVWRDEGFDDSSINSMTLRDLREQVMYAMSFCTSIFFKSVQFCI